jgi:hypothetical protein
MLQSHIYTIKAHAASLFIIVTYLQMLCVSLNVTRGPLNPLTRREADRDGPDRGELSKLAELPLEFILAPPMSSGLLGTN